MAETEATKKTGRSPLSGLIERVLILARRPSIVPTGPEPEIPKDDLPSTVDKDTVEAMLENLRRLVAYEEQRLNSLTTRGTALAGFSGLATAVLSATEGGASLPVTGKVFLGFAVFGLVLVVAGVVLGMLTTRGGTIQSTRQVALYRDSAYQSVSAARVKVQMIDTLIDRLAGLREQNRDRAAWLNRSALMLVVSVLFAAAAVVVRFAS